MLLGNFGPFRTISRTYFLNQLEVKQESCIKEPKQRLPKFKLLSFFSLEKDYLYQIARLYFQTLDLTKTKVLLNLGKGSSVIRACNSSQNR